MTDLQSQGASTLKTTAMETTGLGAIWFGYWQSHSFNDFLQTIALMLSIVGTVLYILNLWRKLRSPVNSREGD